MAHHQLSIGFRTPAALEGWHVEVDTMSGGTSAARICYRNGPQGFALFEGHLSGTGRPAVFATTFKRLDDALDLGDSIQLKMLCNGDGQSYYIMFRSDNSVQSVVYRAPFTTVKDRWTEIIVNVRDFEPARLETGPLEINGWAGPPYRKVPLHHVRQIGFGICRPGLSTQLPFRLEVKSIFSVEPINIQRMSKVQEAARDLEYQIRVKSHAQFKDMHAAFLQYDKDHTGSLDREKLGLICDRFHIGDGDPRVIDALLDRCDTDHDGKIDYREFVAHLGSHVRDSEGDLDQNIYKHAVGLTF